MLVIACSFGDEIPYSNRSVIEGFQKMWNEKWTKTKASFGTHADPSFLVSCYEALELFSVDLVDVMDYATVSFIFMCFDEEERAFLRHTKWPGKSSIQLRR